MPRNTVYVGRPTEWGNPYRVGVLSEDSLYPVSQEQAVAFYKKRLERNKAFRPDIWEYKVKRLKGKNLACWCALDEPCHADALLELVNS